jgi:hypothetical protein
MRRDGIALRIAGRVDGVSRQTITIFCDGRRSSVYQLDEGPFELLAAVPPGERPLELELRAASTLELPERPTRKVGYLLEDVSWSS